MTPEEKLLFDVATHYGNIRMGHDEDWVVDGQPPIEEQLKAAALAYSRPIVAEECARIVEEYTIGRVVLDENLNEVTMQVTDPAWEPLKGQIAAAIREHRKETP